MAKEKSDADYVSETATNLSSVIEKLVHEDDYNYEDIGALFTKSLKLIYNSTSTYTPEDILPHRHGRVQGADMKKIKNYFLRAHIEKDKPFDKENLTVDRVSDDNSLFALVNYFIQEEGVKILEQIGRAVHEGSQIYLRKNPLAETSNFYQYREYRCILDQIQKIQRV